MRRSLIVTFFLALLAPMTATADSTAEREALARLAHELQLVEPLIDAAEAAADPEARRYRFQYEWLRDDLARVRLGIRASLTRPRREPRTFPALRGDYRR